jgi:uncharacterized protein (DUF1697 family)
MASVDQSKVALLRGINVGGKNLIAMKDVTAAFEHAGYTDVRTHGQSGNVLFQAAERAELEDSVERMLLERFGMPIMVVIRSGEELAAVVAGAPADFGSPLLRSDVYFVKHPLSAEAVFADLPELREGVDSMVAGEGALYFSRVAAQATKTRVQRLFAMPVFQRITVRSWKVTVRLAELAQAG